MNIVGINSFHLLILTHNFFSNFPSNTLQSSSLLHSSPLRYSAFVISGRSRLGLCRHGIGSFISLDLRYCIPCGYIHDTGRGSVPIRRHKTHRCGTVSYCPANLQSDREEVVRVLLHPQPHCTDVVSCSDRPPLCPGNKTPTHLEC